MSLYRGLGRRNQKRLKNRPTAYPNENSTGHVWNHGLKLRTETTII
jgi:hypothetical protein